MLFAITLNGNAYMQHVQKLDIEHVVVDAWIQKISKKSADGVIELPINNITSVLTTYITTSTSR